jgi:ribosomal protein L37AE/L43A
MSRRDLYSPAPAWAPRIRRERIARLYRADAHGIRDEELIDALGSELLARCRSILSATEAARGRAQCPICTRIIEHRGGTDELLQCAGCDWEGTWAAYKRSFQHKQLSAGGMEPYFLEYIEKFPRARTARQRMILIDTLLHRYHGEASENPVRPGATNLIQGKMTDIVRFLDKLTYGEGSTPEIGKAYDEWKDKTDRARRIWGGRS